MMVTSAYENLLSMEVEQLDQVGISIPIPSFDSTVIESLCAESIVRFKEMPSLIQVVSPCYIIGDLHGNLFDLLRIFMYADPLPNSRFLFLGDYVDRGQYSIEVITLLLGLMIKYPRNIILIRGNHEFASVNSTYGFLTEVEAQYPFSKLYEQFNEVFSWMPIAAIVNDEIFCVHGGLSPVMTQINDFINFKRPCVTFDDSGISDVVWSDPSTTVKNFEKSTRGSGYLFGQDAIAKFLRETNTKHIIRAHQCVHLGIQRSFDDLVYTVFSSSNYSECKNNRLGMIFIRPNSDIQVFSLPPFTQIDRLGVLFKRIKPDEVKLPIKQSQHPKTKLNAMSLCTVKLDMVGRASSTIPLSKLNELKKSRNGSIDKLFLPRLIKSGSKEQFAFTNSQSTDSLLNTC